MWRLTNAFWGTLAAWTTICGFGSILSGFSLFDLSGSPLAFILIVGGVFLAFTGLVWEKRVKRAQQGARAYRHSLKV